jgi:DNA-binding Lrp family transcriptional regulator
MRRAENSLEPFGSFSHKDIYSLILKYIVINFPITAYRIYRELLLSRSSVYYAVNRLVEDNYVHKEGPHLIPDLTAYIEYAKSACDGQLISSFYRRYGVGNPKAICEFLRLASSLRPMPTTLGEAALRLAGPLGRGLLSRLRRLGEALDVIVKGLVEAAPIIDRDGVRGFVVFDEGSWHFIAFEGDKPIIRRCDSCRVCE